MMYFLSYVFSPVGRFRRRDWHCVWMTTALVNLAGALGYLAVGLQQGWLVIGEKFVPEPSPAVTPAFASVIAGISFAWMVITFVAGVMSTIKRFHDFGSSGWNSLFIYFPLPGMILPVVFILLSMPLLAWGSALIYLAFLLFLFVKLAFFRGHDHDNHYGLSPYQGEQAPPSVGAVWGLVLVLLVASIVPGYLVATQYYDLFMKKKEAMTGEVAKTAAELQAETRAAAKQAHEKTAEAAARGNVDAQYQLSFSYSTGTDHVAKNEAEALNWMSRAAMQGHLAAQYNLGIFYLNGTGAPADARRAYFWLTSAAMRKYASGTTTDYRAQAAAKLTPADIADLNKRLLAWKPVIETPPPPATAAPVPAPAP